MSFSKFPDRNERPKQALTREGAGHHHYDPDQPRVPKGHPDGGQWTDVHEAAHWDGQDGDRTLSDLVPDNFWWPGAQYAQRRSSGRGGSPTSGQLARLEAAQVRADAAVHRIRRARSEMATATECLFDNRRSNRGRRSEGGRSGNEMPGERTEINRIGYRQGCHTCGAKDPRTYTGDFVPDHQLPTVVNTVLGHRQRLYPQCKSCSSEQGVWLFRWWRRQ